MSSRLYEFLLWFSVIGLVGLSFARCDQPTPQPPPVTTTTTTLAPPPKPVCFAPVPGPEGDYIPATWAPALHLWDVIAAREEIGRYTCWPNHLDVGIELMASKLREKGLCASRDDDRVFVQINEALVEEYGLLISSNGCWKSAERMYRGVLLWTPKAAK